MSTLNLSIRSLSLKHGRNIFKYSNLIVALLVFLYLLATKSQGNSNIQYYVSWAQDIFHHQLLDSYHLKDGESLSAEIGELVVPYTPLTLLFFYISARFFFLFLDESFGSYIIVVNFVAVLSTFTIVFLLSKIGVKSKFNLGLIFLATPTVFVFSPLLGFQDTLMTLFLILGIYFINKQRYFLAGVLLASSIWTKQLALMPVVSIFLAFLILRKWKTLLKLSTAGFISTFVILTPFIFTGNLTAYLESQALTSVHTMLSAQATNFPYLGSLLLGIYENGLVAGFNQGGYGLRIENDLIRQSVYLSLGFLTLFIFLFWLYKYSKLSKGKDLDLWLVASFMIFTYYMFSAGVHENHAFAVLPFFLLLKNRKLGKKLYLVFSIALGFHLIITSGFGSSFPSVSQVMILNGSLATVVSLLIFVSYVYCFRLLWREGVSQKQILIS